MGERRIASLVPPRLSPSSGGRGGQVHAAGLLVLCGIAVVLSAAGFAGLRRRDIQIG
jgi:putative exporter of polyketide antibiotics